MSENFEAKAEQKLEAGMFSKNALDEELNWKDWESNGYKREWKKISFYNFDTKQYEELKDAHARTFKPLPYAYAEDKNKVYYKWKEIIGWGEKMEVADWWYAKDTKNVYYYGQKIEWLSPADFDVSTFKKVEGPGRRNEYRKDANRVYYKGKVISEDAKNFAFSGMIYHDGYAIDPSFSSATMYYKDSKNTYLDGESVASKIAFFGEEGLGWFVRIDDKIYYETGSAARISDKEVVWADAESFHVADAENGTFQDKKNIYYSNPIMGMMPKQKPLMIEENNNIQEKQNQKYENTKQAFEKGGIADVIGVQLANDTENKEAQKFWKKQAKLVKNTSKAEAQTAAEKRWVKQQMKTMKKEKPSLPETESDPKNIGRSKLPEMLFGKEQEQK